MVRDPRMIGVGLRRQRLGDATVQRHAPRRRHCLFDRLPCELVPETERRAVVGQYTARQRLLDCRRGLRRQHLEQFERHALTGDRGGIDEATRPRAQPGHSRQGRVAHRHRQRPARGEHLADQKRVAAGHPRDLDRVGVALGGQRPHRLDRQRPKRDRRDGRIGGEIAHEHRQRRVRRELVVAQRHDQRERCILRPASKDSHHIERRRVRPMGVLDRGDRGAGRGQRDLQGASERAPVTGGQLRHVRRAGGRRQLAQRPQRLGHRQGLAAPDMERQPGHPRARSQGAQQRGLADTGFAAYQHYRSAATDAVHDRRKHLKLRVALEQPVHIRDRNPRPPRSLSMRAAGLTTRRVSPLARRVSPRAAGPHLTGGGLPSALAGSPGSHSHTAQAWRNAERANARAAPWGSGLAQTSPQSRTYSPRSGSHRAAAGASVPLAKPSGAG
jgi:hypothetical protein